MFGFGKKNTEFDEAVEAIRVATERLERNLRILRESVGVSQGLMELWSPGRASIGTQTETMATALAAIEVLNNRVRKLEARV